MQRTMVLRFPDHSSEGVHEGEEGLYVPLLGRDLRAARPDRPCRLRPLPGRPDPRHRRLLPRGLPLRGHAHGPALPRPARLLPRHPRPLLALPAPPAKLLPAVRAAAPFLPATLAPLLASCTARLAEHDVLLALADARAFPHPPPGLLAALGDAAARPDILCTVLRQAADLHSADLLAALRCFLTPASDRGYDAMAAVKARWKDAAVLAVDMCVDEATAGVQATRRAAMLLMMGHDGFTSPEVCLHYLFAWRNVEDPLVLAAAVSELDGGEVASLLSYLAKWVGKYSRFPEALALPEAAGMLKLEQCKSVPSLVAVARAMGLVLDQHFSHLVLNAELRQDLLAAGVMAKELTVEAESSGPILNLLRWILLVLVLLLLVS